MNSWHAQQLKFALGVGSLMSFYGIAGFLTYKIGPSLGLQLNHQIVVFILLLLTFPFALILGYVATKRAAKKEEGDAAAAAGAATPTSAGEQSNVATAPKDVPASQELAGSLEEVVNFLKSSNLGGENAKDAVYALPWYIIAGAPTTGKSSLVLGSNFNFQTLPSQRQSELKLIRPTRGIDWRVTNEAVFIDTGGRFLTEGADETEWSSLLETINKYRGGRPVDGMLVVADTGRILATDERQNEELAKVMRARIDDAMARLKVRFPVYLVFTHADAIEGFRDSFSTSKKEGETLVWGATIPIEKSESAHAMFDEEFALLQDSVMKRRLIRLSAPFPPVRQLRVFNFPLHFGAAKKKLGAFVAALFRPNPFSENPFLRGYYFTAAPISKAAAAAGVPASIGTTYFTERFFRDVVLRDKDLVATFIQQRQKPPIWSWLLTILGATLVVALLTLAGVSLVNNRKLLKSAESRGGAVILIAKEDGKVNPLSKPPDAAARELNAIEELRVLMADLDKFDRQGAPFYFGMGLYSGGTIYKGSDRTKGLLNIYYNAIDRRFMAPTARRLEEELRKFVAAPTVTNQNNLTLTEEDSLIRGYDMLRVYLMLSDQHRTRSNADDIVRVLREFWFTESKLPANMQALAEEQLKFYAKQSDRFDGYDKFPRIKTDLDLIANVRKRLLVLPPYKRYYKEKVTEISKIVDDKFQETSVDGILLRRGASSQYLEGKVSVPGAYTVEGFKLMDKAINEADLSKINWVVNDEKTAVQEITETIKQDDANRIREQYFRDYADRWRDFVKGVRVKPYRKENDKDQSKMSAKDALQAFSSSNSPMRVLLEEIERNTNLSAEPVPSGWWDTIKNWFDPQKLPDTGGTSAVEREFGPLFSFAGKKGDQKSSKLDEYQTALNDISLKYSSFSDGDVNRLATMPDDEKNREFPQLKQVLGRIDGLIKPIKDSKDSPVGPFLADLLQQPVGNLAALLSADSIKQLGERWSNEVVPLAAAAEQGYPFDAAESNADFQKLKEYLAPNSGKLSQFYDQNLKKYFDGNPGSLKLKDPNTAPFTPEFVDYLNKAFTVQKSLFGKGDDMKFDYNFELTNPKDAIVEITIDGVTLSSADKPSSPISFPATAGGGGNGVIIKLMSTAATTATSGPASANPTAPAVNSNSAPKPTTEKPQAAVGPDEKQFLGPWGLFRFFDASGPQKQSDNSYLLSYKLKSGKVLTAKITPSGVDPFNKEIYRLRAPKTILK